jgi:hypothetical protein
LDPTGLLNDVFEGAFRIDDGRKGFAIPGKERQGRISYENGIEMPEKALLTQRAANMKAAKGAYVEKQGQALAQ